MFRYETEWWHHAAARQPLDTEQRSRLHRAGRYRFGDAFLELHTNHLDFCQRFQHVYAECAVSSLQASARSSQVWAAVQATATPDVVALAFDDPEPLDLLDYSLRLFPKRGYGEMPSPVPGWRCLRSPTNPAVPFMIARENMALFDGRQAWQAFVGSCVINRVLRLQRDVLFFHAASVGIAGSGVLLLGPKGAGKSTLSLALAARGYNFLGDEIAAIRQESGEMLPFRRAVSIRPGPCAAALAHMWQDTTYVPLQFPDGTARLSVKVRELFPHAAAHSVRLHHAVFLRQFASKPCLEPFTFQRHHVRLLQPLSCTLWGCPPGHQLMAFLRLLSRIRCFFLDVGEPEATADLLERLV